MKYWSLMCLLLTGGFVSIYCVTMVDFVGLEYFARVYGFSLLGSAIGYCAVGPVSGEKHNVLVP